MGLLGFDDGFLGGLAVMCVGIFITIYTLASKAKLPNFYFKVDLWKEPPVIIFTQKKFADLYRKLNGTFNLAI